MRPFENEHTIIKILIFLKGLINLTACLIRRRLRVKFVFIKRYNFRPWENKIKILLCIKI